MPRWLSYTLVVLLVLSWVPLAIIAKARVSKSTQPRIHIIPDMDNQPKLKAQSSNPMFADGRAMRPPVAGAVAVDAPDPGDPVTSGRRNGEFVEHMPMRVTMGMMRRGQQRFDIYCAPCHGLVGEGDGMVAKRADQLQEGTWVPPTSLQSDLVRSHPDGKIFDIITNGIRNMPPYGPQIPVADRWAIVAYVRALQRSQHASVGDVPPELRSALR